MFLFFAKRGGTMEKRILDRKRIRTIDGGFAFIPHRFLSDGFLDLLSPSELLLYLFLVLAADADGLSYYGDKRVCKLLQMSAQDLAGAREALVDWDLIAYAAPLYQVLELPYIPEEIREDSTVCASSFADLFRMTED